MTTPTDRLVRGFIAKMVAAVGEYEEHKAMYAAVKEAYRAPGRDHVTATFKAANDPRLGEATALAVWHRDEAAMYAAVISALRADEPVYPAVHIAHDFALEGGVR